MGEWINIGIAILSGGGIAGLISIYTIKATKKKAVAEAELTEANVDGAEIDNDIKIVDKTMIWASEIKKELAEVKARVNALEEKDRRTGIAIVQGFRLCNYIPKDGFCEILRQVDKMKDECNKCKD